MACNATHCPASSRPSKKPWSTPPAARHGPLPSATPSPPTSCLEPTPTLTFFGALFMTMAPEPTLTLAAQLLVDPQLQCCSMPRALLQAAAASTGDPRAPCITTRCQRSRSAMQRCQSFSRLAVGFGWGTTWSALLSVLGSAALPTRGVGTSIPDSAGGLRAVGLSFIGLSGLVSGMLPSNPALCDLSNAICCCCCAPPRRYPGTCRTHHHHPSPGHSLTSISSLLTRPLPSLCALSAGLVRRLERPLCLWPSGRLPRRRE